jgi:hypothetical protein
VTIDQVVRNFSVESIEKYLVAGGDINATFGYRNWSLLHQAAEWGDCEAVAWLVRRGARLDARDRAGNTPLHIAVDADIDTANQSGRTTTLSTTRALIEAGACEDVCGEGGGTPRDVAAAYGQDALDLYDGLSRVTWTSEVSIAAFAATCGAILERAGYSARILDDQDQLSVAENDTDHDRVWFRFFLSAGQLYARRREPRFEEGLVEQVRQGFERLREQRGS